MGWVELSEGPDALRARAAQLSGQAEGFAARLSGLLQEIAAIEAARPWGGDQYGTQFEASYQQATEEGPFAQAVDGQVRDLGPEASEIGIALTAGATDYQAEDIRAADDITRIV
ncbi:hypothetical protein [Cryptosporangium sp. NPDC048952]|uniref:hypothetical protein n=1 Tax=Cryptosporangium sp. NPDC048952 TaxID=3363961 RepID=UPI0037215090